MVIALALIHGCKSPPSGLTRARPEMNIFGDLFDDGLLKEQKPYPKPLLPSLVKNRAASYVLRESMLSFSGEDFTVRDTQGNTVMQIEGANINLGGKVLDKVTTIYNCAVGQQ